MRLCRLAVLALAALAVAAGSAAAKPAPTCALKGMKVAYRFNRVVVLAKPGHTVVCDGRTGKRRLTLNEFFDSVGNVAGDYLALRSSEPNGIGPTTRVVNIATGKVKVVAYTARHTLPPRGFATPTGDAVVAFDAPSTAGPSATTSVLLVHDEAQKGQTLGEGVDVNSLIVGATGDGKFLAYWLDTGGVAHSAAVS